MARVVLFSTPSCSWCKRAKRYLKENRVRFKEVDIERDPKAGQDLVKKTGQMGVPIIKIGSQWIVGFDQPRIERELGVGPEECLAIEDSPAGVKAALVAGVEIVAVTTDLTRQKFRDTNLLDRGHIVDDPRTLPKVVRDLISAHGRPWTAE